MSNELQTIVTELRALIAAPQSATALKAFLRAFRRRRQLPWLHESAELTPDLHQAYAEGLQVALRTYRGEVFPPLPGRVPTDVVTPLTEALPHVTSDLAARDFLGTVERVPAERSLRERLLDALRQYADDDRKNIRRSADPW